MCTLVLLQRPGELVAVSGNRNELLKRPSSGPRVDKGILTPRDDLMHGTWLGLNGQGLFACVTNRRGAMIDPSRRSRGLLVLEALQAASAAELRERVGELRGDRHNGFHLAYADLRHAFVTWSDGIALQHVPLPADRVHVITERSFGAGESAREREIAAAFADREETLAAWREPMTRHAQQPIESACVHADDIGYGTRSSLQLFVRPTATEGLWTDGHPCVNAPRDLAPLLSELARSSSGSGSPR
jgi:hypothetical protein